jgi:glycerol uptake facilitator-like aquaporin
MPIPTPQRSADRLIAEALGTAFLLAAVVGSGIMAERLAAGNIALALLANSIATGAALIVIILTVGPISGAHLNPAVTLTEALRGAIAWRLALAYSLVQIVAAMAGVALAHLMFGLPILESSSHARAGVGLLVGEAVATFGLVAVIRGCARSRPTAIPFAVGLYITAAYWFTSSTSFANPAVTIARGFTDTFTGIRPADVPGFVAAQILGALAAALLFRWFDRSPQP